MVSRSADLGGQATVAVIDMDPLWQKRLTHGYRRIRAASRIARVILMALTLLLQGLGPVVSQRLDTCDWTVWDGLEQPEGVRSIFGGCSEGHVEWRHPYGAVRVTLQFGTPNKTHFEACFTARTHYVVAKISLEDSTSGTPTLTPIATLDEGQSELAEVCVTSRGRPVVVYLEALVDRPATNVGLVELDYDNYRVFPKVTQDDMEECRPCSDAEILYAACSSDFVVQGSMSDVIHDTEHGESRIQLSVDKILRQKGKLFKAKIESEAGTSISARSSHHGIETRIRALDLQSRTTEKSALFIPSKCGVHHGVGDFVFMGRIRLKRALLRCAPRLQDFKAIWERSIRTGTNLCLL